MRFVTSFFITVVILSSAELFLLVEVAAKFGFMLTFMLCVFTGIAGGAVIRSQGIDTLRNINRSIAQGMVPATEIVSGLMLIILGAFLMVPGFITDILGFILLIRPVRNLAASYLIYKFKGHVKIFSNAGSAEFQSESSGINEAPGQVDGNVIDADFREIDPSD
ncbi:FxsA family protein [bacterium]|nr:FxsA family protein [bacterium]